MSDKWTKQELKDAKIEDSIINELFENRKKLTTIKDELDRMIEEMFRSWEFTMRGGDENTAHVLDLILKDLKKLRSML